MIPKAINEEVEYMKEHGTPRCMKCKRNMVNGIDSITKKVSKYLWVYDCDCNPKNLGLMVG